MALPPIVNDDTNDVANRDTIRKLIFRVVLMVLAMGTQQAPDITPHISPITSLQKLATLSVFFLKVTANLAPLTFLAAIELNTLMLEAVTDTPTISNMMPNVIKNNKRIISNMIGIFGNRLSDVRVISIDITKVIINIFIIQL